MKSEYNRITYSIYLVADKYSKKKNQLNWLNYILLLIAFGFLFTSCKKSFLDVAPQGQLSAEVLANKKGVEGLLIGAYAALDGQGDGVANGDMVSLTGNGGYAVSPDNWIYGSLCGGDAHKGSDAGDQPAILAIANFKSNPSNDFFNDKWRVVYEGISRCNTVLSILKQVNDMSDDEKSEAAAEARFLRGHFYFDLKKMFNMVPWKDENSNELKIPNDKDIFSNIEGDFKDAMDSLPETPSNIGRANKWAAAAYLAKVYLYEKKYPDAKTLFEQVINEGVTTSGKKYALTPLFDDNFKPETEDNSEVVFGIENAANDGSGGTANANQGDMLNYPYGGPFSCCGFYQPSVDLVNSYRTNPSTGLPYLDDYNDHPIKNDMGLQSGNSFTPDAGTIDPRLDWTVGRRSIPYLDWGAHPGQDWIRDQVFSGPYSPKKTVYWQATQDAYYDGSEWAPGSALNNVLMRFSDVLLMAAEAEVQTGDLNAAEKDVNLVRNRAANPAGFVHTYVDPDNPLDGFTDTPAADYFIKPYPAGNFAANGNDYALKAIYFERKLELAMEGKRFFDLVRWGIADKALNAYFQYEGKITTDISNAHYVTGKNEYFPIPQRQIDLSTVDGQPTLKQNPGYH